MSAFADFDSFVQGQKRRIAVADVDAVARGGLNFHGLAAEMRAGVFVWTAAALERFLPAFIDESLELVNQQGSDLRKSVVSDC